MSSIQERLQLKRVPLDTWNVREQLCLASAVVRSGDQNWMSVSRALKTVGEPNRPPDWYSQKSCAAQYGALLEHVETPKRKKRSSEGAVETPQESILKRLTEERIAEIQKNVAEMDQQYDQLKNEIAEARNPSTTEDRLRELWAGIEAGKRARERETARRIAWLKEREEKRARADRTWRPPPQAAPVAGPAAAPASPLLTSLLKSSPVVTTPQHISHPANSVDSISPSAGAPTLSMLLEKSAGGSSPHDNKHAAIEHIKNQLVQIEQQLKANSSTPPPAPITAPATAPSALPPEPPPASSVDIDDIEIKAEDVYAFRDIDINIPPVTSMHKGSSRMMEKSVFKRDEPEIPEPDVAETATEHVQEIKEEQMVLPPAAEELPAETVTQLPAESVQEEPPPIPEAPEPAPESLIAFPEVKFPNLEIKVIQPDEQKIKEEVKEPEPPLPEPEKEQEAEVNVERTPTPIPVIVDEEKIEPTSDLVEPEPSVEPEQPLVPDTSATAPPELESMPDPQNIPLPPDPSPEPIALVQEVVPDPPLPPEPEAPPVQEEPEEAKQEEASPDEKETAAEVESEHVAEDVKTEDDEDSIPLNEMVRAEAQPPAPPTEPPAPEEEEGPKEEPLAELEETHTETDDDTPMELSREEEKDGKKRRDYSRKKKPDSRTCSGSESAAEASAPESPSASDAERQHRLWKKSVMLVYSRLCAHKYASLFLRPITDEEAPGYSLVVRRPMDLTCIRRNIDAGLVRTTAEFQRDVLLMLSNALMYNSSSHSVYMMAKEMHDEAQCQLGMLLAAQAHAGLVNAPPAALRRKRRRPESPLSLSHTPVPTKRHH